MAKTRKTELDVDDSIAQKVPIPEPEVKKEAPPPEPGKKEEKPERKKLAPRLKILIIAGLVSAVIIMAGITALLVFGDSKKTEEPVAEVVEPEPEPEPELEPEPEPEPKPEIELKKLENFHMEPFMITYNTRQGEQFLRIGFVLQLSNKEAKAEIDQNLVIVRDAIFFFLKRRELKDFNVLKRKKELLLELKRLLDRSIQNGRVDKVMITEMNIY